MTNGWGKMNSYAPQIQPADRWAIVAYIRALQAGHNPDLIKTMNNPTGSNSNTAPHGAATPAGETHGGTR
jgi:mono/diheme cytochrome c family protein